MAKHRVYATNVTSSVLRLEPYNPADTALSVAPWPMTYGHLKSRVRAVSSSNPDYWQNAEVVFDYQDAQNYKFAGLRVGGGNWVIGAMEDGTRTMLVKTAVSDLQVNHWYALDLVVARNEVTLYADGQEVVSWQPGGGRLITGGQVGLMAERGIAEFQELKQWDVGQGHNNELGNTANDGVGCIRSFPHSLLCFLPACGWAAAAG